MSLDDGLIIDACAGARATAPDMKAQLALIERESALRGLVLDLRGAPFTKTAQVRMVGNSVCPPVAEAFVRANLVKQQEIGERAAD